MAGKKTRSDSREPRYSDDGNQDQEVDYIELFWRVSYYWSHIPQLSQLDLFGNQPLYLISQALIYGRKLERERLHMQELGLARFNCEWYNSKIDLTKHAPAKWEEFCFHKPKTESKEITPAIANTIYAVMKDGYVPEWLFHTMPRREIFAFRQGFRTIRPRLWIDAQGSSIALFCPFPQGEFVNVGAAIILDGFEGHRIVKDVDSHEEFMVLIPKQDSDNLAVYGDRFKMIWNG